MTKQVLFIQGGGEQVHDEWDNKLVASLKRELGPSYEVRYPRMPNEADPNYTAWSKAIAKEIEALDDGAFVLGHSVGGTILIAALADQTPRRKLSGLILAAAPFVGANGWPSDDIAPMDGLGARLSAETEIYLFHGSADETAPPAHVELYAKAIPQANIRKLKGRDHQLNNDMRELAQTIRSLEDTH